MLLQRQDTRALTHPLAVIVDNRTAAFLERCPCVARSGLGRFAAFGPPTRISTDAPRCARHEDLKFTKSMLRRKTEAKPTDRAAGELRDAWPRRAKRGRGQVGATSFGRHSTRSALSVVPPNICSALKGATVLSVKSKRRSKALRQVQDKLRRVARKMKVARRTPTRSQRSLLSAKLKRRSKPLRQAQNTLRHAGPKGNERANN